MTVLIKPVHSTRTPDHDLFVDLNPIAWKAPTAFARRVAGQVRAGTAPAPEVVAYQAGLRAQLAALWGPRDPITDPCRVDLFFARRLESYYGPSGRLVVKHRQDLTNLRKSTEDAMQADRRSGFGGVIKNDVLIIQGYTDVVAQGRDVENPFVVIHIYLDPEPTFWSER